MLPRETQESVARLARGVLSLKPLLAGLGPPVPLPSCVTRPEGEIAAAEAGDGIGLEALINRVASRSGAPRFELAPETEPGGSRVFARILQERLAEVLNPALRSLSFSALAQVDGLVDEVAAESFEGCTRPSRVISFDGAALPAFDAGPEDAEAVVLAAPCGMPASLCEQWIRFLVPKFRVVTWESRGLFLPTADFDERLYSVAAQGRDLIAVLDHFGIDRAHLAGLCGGAAIALAAAVEQPRRVLSLSLWHGDYELGGGAPKTHHQQDLKILMTMAAESRESAAAVRTAICNSMATKPLPELAHMILYPYASAELFYRYGKLNGSIMSTDAANWLGEVRHRTLVVTSEDDTTAHPQGSRQVAEQIAGARLHVARRGDHISLFRAEPETQELALSYFAGDDS